MNPGAIRRAKPHKTNRTNTRAAGLVLVLIALLTLPFWKFFRTSQGKIPQSTAPVSDSSSLPFFWSNTDFPTPLDASSIRPVYPYSVIPHGVESAQELRDAIHHDPVVSAHYSDFRVRAARRIRLAGDHRFFVSYRIGNQIYWTNKKITLHSGEKLLSDGEHFARARCGNRLSEAPATPTSPSEPTNGIFDTPVVPLPPELTETLPGSPTFPAGAPSVLILSSSPTSQRAPRPGGWIPPFTPIPCCDSSPSSNSPTRPVVPTPVPVPPPSATPPSGAPPQPPPYFPPEPPSSPPTGPPVATPEPSALTLAAVALSLWLVVRKLRQN